MEFAVKVENYLSEGEIREIAKEEIRSEIRNKINKQDLDRIITNASYDIVWKRIDEEIDEDISEMIKTKVFDIVVNMSNFNVFRKKMNLPYDEGNSLAQDYLEEYVEENKELIRDKVIEKIKELDEDYLRYKVEDMIFDVIEERLIGKEKNEVL